jgi:hypothetical protein
MLIAVIDCVLSEWEQWSECDVKCGTGMMSRTRTILRAPENGGKHCGSLTQKRGCQGYKCNSVHEHKALKGKKWLQFIIIWISMHFYLIVEIFFIHNKKRQWKKTFFFRGNILCIRRKSFCRFIQLWLIEFNIIIVYSLALHSYL